MSSGPQRGPIRQSDSAGNDPQMQSMIDKYGIDALRSMAKQQMQSSSAPASTISTNTPVNMPGLPAPKGSRASGGFRSGGQRRGSGFVNPGGVDASAAARANQAAMREQLLQQMAMMKLRGGASADGKTPEEMASTQATTQPQSEQPVAAGPVQTASMQSYSAPTLAPAAQAVQPVSGMKLFLGALAVATVVGGGAYLAAKMAADEPKPAMRKARR